MAARSRCTLLLALGACAACIEPRGYPCDRNEQCMLDGASGHCEAVGFCSYPDDTCPSLYRYESRAGGGFASQCVEPLVAGSETGSSSASASASSSSSSSDPTTTGEPLPDGGSTGPCPGGACGCADRVFAGALHSCALGSDGLLYCWGGNVFGQLGRGSNATAFDNPQPVLLPEGSVIEQIDAKEHMCALLETGDVFCWGRNDTGQSDWTNVGGAVFAPRRVAGLDEFMPEQIAVGYTISCAARGTDLRCWGEFERVAVDPTVLPDPLPANVTHLAVGELHYCAALDNQSIICFGNDSGGQLGDDNAQTLGGMGLVALPPHDGVIDLAAGRHHTCAILAMGAVDQVICWGSNVQDEAGAFSEIDQFLPTPQAVAALDPGDYERLSLGEGHSCVIHTDGRLFCWDPTCSG